jgi:hypothetical protein
VAATAPRRQLVAAYAAAHAVPAGARLALLAVIVHRLAPGVRLM